MKKITLRTTLAFLVLIVGCSFSIYIGVYWAYLCGIAQCVHEWKSADCNAMNFALGVFKVIFAAPIGVCLFAVTCAIALVISD